MKERAEAEVVTEMPDNELRALAIREESAVRRTKIRSDAAKVIAIALSLGACLCTCIVRTCS